MPAYRVSPPQLPRLAAEAEPRGSQPGWERSGATSSHVFFTELRSIWYVVNANANANAKAIMVPNLGLKVLPSLNYLNQFFTEVSLAHAIMGDGYWERDGQTVFICTDNFSFDEIQIFILFLYSRFGLKATSKKRGACYRVRFSSANKNQSLLRSLVTPPLSFFNVV